MKTRNTIAAITLVLGMTAIAAPLQESVPVKLGPKAFRDGDVIEIQEVKSTSGELAQGDTIAVKGRYRLDSRKSASLQLLLTQTQGDGAEETDPAQIVKAKSGWHPFEASITVKHRGVLHLTFYDQKTGRPFGGVYFGTSEQMKNAGAISVSHYLSSELAAGG